jgi:hypothetical protein
VREAVVIGLRSEEEKRHILDRAAELRRTRFNNVSVGPDMTRMQRRAEEQLSKETEKRNEQLTAEDREKGLRWMVVGRKGEKRMVKGVEREQQNYGRREAQLGDFISRELRDRGNGNETGARRKEYFNSNQQRNHTLSGPALLAPRQQNPNYIPIQHSRQSYSSSSNNSWQQSHNNQPQQQQQQNYQQQSYQQPAYQQQNYQQLNHQPQQNRTAYNSNQYRYSAPDNAVGGAGAGYSGGNGAAMQNVQYNQNYSYNGNNGGGGLISQSNNGNGGGGVYGNVQLTWRGGPTNNDSGYTEPNWQERQYDENGEHREIRGNGHRTG